MNTQCASCRYAGNASVTMTGVRDQACRLLRDEVTTTAKILALMLQDLAKHGRCPGFQDVTLQQPDCHLADVSQDLRRTLLGEARARKREQTARHRPG